MDATKRRPNVSFRPKRDKPLGLKLTSEHRRKLERLCRAQQVTMTDMLEQLIDRASAGAA